MSDLGGEIKQCITQALPNLAPDKVDQLSERLVGFGVESIEDLHYVETAPRVSLSDLLQPIQIRKLFDRFKREVVQENCHPPGMKSTSSASSNAYSPRSLPSSSTAHSPRSLPSSPITWPERFQVPWEQMPRGLREALTNGKRPTAADRRQMIRILADDIRKHEQNPSRAQCLGIAHRIVRDFPRSFADFHVSGNSDQSAEGGYSSLLQQLKTRIENLNRNNTLVRRRFEKQREPNFAEDRQTRGPTDKYGCTKWQPELPFGETKDQQEEMRIKIVEFYLREGVSAIDRQEVSKLTKDTYYLQRCCLNTSPAPSIETIKAKWPLLCTQKGLCEHFEMLTDIDVGNVLARALQESGQILVDFFKNAPTNNQVKEVLSKTGDGMVAMVLKLLMAHFQEGEEGLLLHADRSATAVDIQSTLPLSGSPRLIILDETMDGPWLVSMEGQVLCEGQQPTILSSLAAIFVTYYVFNLAYQEEAAATLEFIQRRFIGINPDRVTKASQGKVTSKKTGRMVQKKAVMINPHVSTLLRRFTDFQFNL